MHRSIGYQVLTTSPLDLVPVVFPKTLSTLCNQTTRYMRNHFPIRRRSELELTRLIRPTHRARKLSSSKSKPALPKNSRSFTHNLLTPSTKPMKQSQLLPTPPPPTVLPTSPLATRSTRSDASSKRGKKSASCLPRLRAQGTELCNVCVITTGGPLTAGKRSKSSRRRLRS